MKQINYQNIVNFVIDWILKAVEGSHERKMQWEVIIN